MDITEVARTDEPLMRRAWEVEQAAVLAGQPDASLRTWDWARVTYADPSPYRWTVRLVAVEDGEVVGTAEYGGPLQDNRHLAEIEVNVAPGHRRRGIGRALHERAVAALAADGRRTVHGEAYARADGALPAVAFAEALGYRDVHREDRMVLSLPAAPPTVDAAPGDEIVTWGARCPDEYVAAYCAMRTQMSNDVPVGEVDREPVVYDEERLRTSEASVGRSYDQLVAAARTVDGSFAGYSVMFLPRGSDQAVQDDTLVMPDHRGRRLGLQLKAANLATLGRDHPDYRSIVTWVDPDNRAMRRTNLVFGYVVADRLHEMQREL